MTKKHFVELATTIKQANIRSTRENGSYTSEHFSKANIGVIADFCQSQNAQFDRERFLAACGVTA